MGHRYAEAHAVGFWKSRAKQEGCDVDAPQLDLRPVSGPVTLFVVERMAYWGLLTVGFRV